MDEKKPVHEVKLGTVRATIWDNGGNDPVSRFSISVTRFYKNENAWKDTHSLRRDDLPVAATALDMCYSWIWRRETVAKDATRTVNQALSAARRSR